MFVKICGLSEEEHVEVAIDAGADALGFVFAESVRKIDPAQAAAITRKVPDTVKKVAVMLHPSAEELQCVLEEFEPDILQADVDSLPGLDMPERVECWPVLRDSSTITSFVIAVLQSSENFLFEGSRSGSGETVDWAVAARVAAQGRMILAGGLGVDNVGEAIETVRPFGVDVSSGVENAPGRKDSELIRKFIGAAKAAGKNV